MSDQPDPPSNMPVPPALQALRDRIDDVDHRLLSLLEERSAIVAEVAAVKQETGFGIRDFVRERDLLADRGGRGQAAGLSSSVVESLFRVILWASRDRQAALGAEIPPDMPSSTVAIIGGHGGMGTLMGKALADLGHEILVADLDTTLSAADAAATADVTIVSVPIEVTCDVIAQIAPHCREDGLLMDVTSTKSAPMEAMLATCAGSVIGTHPLFGPSIHSLQGQRIVVVPGRDEHGWMDWLTTVLGGRGLTLLETTADDHDAAMGVVQVLTHHGTEVLGRTLQKLDVDIQRTLEFTSPIYLMDLLMSARHFAQSSDLYASIQMHNPRTASVLDALRSAGDELHGIVTSGDREAFKALFAEVREHFGEFSVQALEQSSFLIDRLVERG